MENKEAEGIKTFFSGLAEGLIEAGRWRRVFDFLRDNLRILEGKGDGNRTLADLVLAGQVKMARDVLNAFDRWPCPEYKERYGPRADALFQKAIAARRK